MQPNNPVQKISHDHSYLEKVVMENNETFEVLVIKSGSIKHLSWMDPDYSKKLMELDLFETVKTNADNFLEVIATKLNVNNYNVKDLHVKTEIIGEEPYYLYEMLYIDLEKETTFHNDNNLNELASLININGEQIYSNAIIFRNHLPSLSDSMTLCDVSKKDIERLLFDRVHTKIVTCDEGKWVEDRVVGDLNNFAQIFFDNEKYEKLEIPFLMHNINIWYTTSLDGNHSLCGNLIDDTIDKCIWFSMKSDEYRGNLSLDEVTKIIHLSTVLKSYKTPEKFFEEKNDSIGRKIIYNKYKVLDYLYNISSNIKQT